jgi:hypothetical protein
MCILQGTTLEGKSASTPSENAHRQDAGGLGMTDFIRRAEAEAKKRYLTPEGEWVGDEYDCSALSRILGFIEGAKWCDAQPRTLTAADLEAGAKKLHEFCGVPDQWEEVRTFYLEYVRVALAAIPNIVLPESEA